MITAFDWAAATHTGHRRSANEDAWAGSDQFWVVCDGMGGHADGAKASAIAAQTAETRLRALTPSGITPAALVDLMHECDQAVKTEQPDGAQSPRELMGTTIVLAALDMDGNLVFGWTGDSLLLAHEHPGTYTMTPPHSFPLGGLEHVLGHLQGPAGPEAYVIDAEDLTSSYVLCSDGLTDYNTEEAVHEVLSRESTATVSAQQLIDLTLKGDAGDNIALISLRLKDATT